MFELTIILISFAILVISAHLYRCASGEPVWRLNMLTYSFYVLVALSFVASVVVVLDIPFMGYEPDSSVSYLYGDEGRHLAVWVMVLWMLVAIPLSALFINLFLGARPVRALMVSYRRADIQIGWGLSEKTLLRLVWSVSILLALILLYQQPDTTALSSIISSGNVYESQIIRRQTTEGTGFVWLDSMFNQGTLQWLSYIAFAMMVVTGKWKWRLLFAVLFVLMVYFALSIGSPSRILYYLLGIGFVRSLLGRGFIKAHEIVAVAGLLVILFVTFKGAEGNILNVLWVGVATRIFLTQLFGTYVALDVFPRQHEFIGFGSTAKMVHELFDGTSLESYGIIMMGYYHPASVEAGYAGHLTTIFMGEAWANFGLLGVMLAPLWVGAVVQFVNRAFIRRRKSVIAVALYAYLAITFGYASDFVGFYYPLGTILFVVGGFSVIILGRIFILKFTDHRRSAVPSSILQTTL